MFKKWPLLQNCITVGCWIPANSLKNLIPNHQFSFCWIYLPLLILWIIRFFCQPLTTGHHRTPTSLVWVFISQVGLSGLPGVGRYSKDFNWSGDSSGISRGPLLFFIYMTSLGPTGAWFLLPFSYMMTRFSFHAQISDWLCNISAWMKEHHWVSGSSCHSYCTARFHYPATL